MSDVKEFNMYEYLQVTGVISDKDIRSVRIVLTKKNNEPASVVITSMKFCEEPEKQGIFPKNSHINKIPAKYDGMLICLYIVACHLPRADVV